MIMEKGVTFKQKLLYAQGCLGQNVVNLIIVTWVVFFFSGGGGRTPLMPLAIASIFFGIGRIIDIITDPIMGYISDNVTFKSGRRRPFIFWGAPLLALSLFLIWIPPTPEIMWTNIAWLFIFSNFYFTMLTVTAVPYRAVIPDIAPSSKERISLSAWMAIFGTFGVLIASLGGGPMIDAFGYPIMGIIIGAIVLVSFWISLLGIKERRRSESDLKTKVPFLNTVLQTIKNKQFSAFAIGIICFQVGLQVFMIVLPFFVTEVLGQGIAQVAIYQGAFVVIMLIGLPLWIKIGNKIGKRKGQLASLLLLAIICPFFFFIGYLPIVPPTIQAIIFFALFALPIAGLYVFPNAIVADITDYDELKTKKRREGIYYAGFGFVEKAAWAIAAFLVAAILPVFGFTAEYPLGIRLVGPIAGLLAFIGFIRFWRYRLPDKILGKSLEEIEGVLQGR
jgi:GPH family glycoside/pentoside/hexuronide:cation symporter